MNAGRGAGAESICSRTSIRRQSTPVPAVVIEPLSELVWSSLVSAVTRWAGEEH